MNDTKNPWGVVVAVSVILVLVVLAVWLLHPILGLLGLFGIPAVAKKTEADYRAEIASVPSNVLVSQQSSTLQSAVSAIKSDALATAEQQSTANLTDFQRKLRASRGVSAPD